jgi:hypothetical protein
MLTRSGEPLTKDVVTKDCDFVWEIVGYTDEKKANFVQMILE